MKKSLLVIFSILALSSWAHAQVIATFETGLDGYGKAYGGALTGVTQIADPTGKSAGVLQAEITTRTGGEGDKAAFSKAGLDATGATMITYSIYLPAGTPDNLMIKPYGQDQSWSWGSQTYYAKSLPKDKWTAVSFSFDQANASDAGWSLSEGKLQACGIEFNLGMLTGKDSTWAGKILIDDIRLLGVVPKSVANFDAGTDGFSPAWGGLNKGVTKVDDPTGKSTGVLQIELGTRQPIADGFKGAVGKSGVNGADFEAIQYMVYLPQGTPDSLYFSVYIPDNSWSWAENVYYCKDIPKEKWFPVYANFNVAAASNSGWQLSKGAFAQVGLEFKADLLKGADTTWTGKVLIDNVNLIGSNVAQKWVVADFQSTQAGVQGFSKWYGNSMTSLTRADVDGKGVLKMTVDLTTSEHKAAISKSSVRFYSDTLKKAGTAVTMDIFLPADYAPVGGQVGLIVNGNEGGWNETKYDISATDGPTAVVPGKWVTLTADLSALISAGSIKDPTLAGTVGVQLYQADGTYKGDILFDNLTIVGIPEPIAPVSTPMLTAVVKSRPLLGINSSYDYASFAWEDNKLGTETYNIYASATPITDIKAAGVTKIVGDIPHGMGKYGYRPWTADGATKTYYFAITAFDGVKETALLDQGKVGPLTLTTSKAFTLKYVKDFGKKFVLDGLDDEFAAYKADMIIPEGGNYEADTTKKWTASNTDMNFKVTMLIDDKYLYISADVTDDDLRDAPAQQAWEGDALEFYWGFYDASNLYTPHAKNYENSKGDWRFGFNALGNTTLAGGASTTIKGVESTVYPKFTGDGYIIESRIELDSLAANGKFQMVPNMLMPFRIDANDWDPTKGDTQRSLIVQAGSGAPDTDENWKRPDSWAYLKLSDFTTGVEDKSSLPSVYALYNNYPNPFNPSTVIKFDLPKASNVTLKIYDVIGREVQTLVNKDMAAGTHMVDFNASRLSSGIYFYKIEAGNFVQTKKMILIK